MSERKRQRETERDGDRDRQRDCQKHLAWIPCPVIDQVPQKDTNSSTTCICTCMYTVFLPGF